MILSTGEVFSGTPAYAEAFKAADITSDRMKNAIKDWVNLYFQYDPTDKEDACQQIPYTIVRKLTKTVFSEYDAASTDQFAGTVLDALAVRAGEAMQMALIGGESLLKPVPGPNGFFFSVVPRHHIRVFGRDAAGHMTDIGTEEKSTFGKHYYTLLERRTVDEKGFLTIRNMLYRSLSETDLGTRVGLNTLPRYADLMDEYTFAKSIGSIGLISVRTPMANCVDGSADAVSVYAAAVGLIHRINRNEAQLSGEFDRAESRIVVSDDMLVKTDKYGKHRLDDNVFVGLDDDPDNVGITIFNPPIREASFLARKQEYLRNVENVIGLKRGLLSEVEAAERTATEITSSAGEYNLTIVDFQRVWEQAVMETMRLCGILGQLYKVPNAHEIAENAVVINWGNGVLYDEAKTNSELLALVNAGLLKPEHYLGWYFNMPCDTDQERAKIREKYMPEPVEEDGE